MRWRTVRRTGYVAAAIMLAIVAASVLWTRIVSAGHTFEAADAPKADVIVVFGTQVSPGVRYPYPVLRNRLEVALRLFRDGKAPRILVSGDANGASGNETATMSGYLADRGVPREAILVDPSGLDSFQTCTRARDKFGLHDVLLVTQPFHLYRALALCRSAGLDAKGVFATCHECTAARQTRNTVRDWFAAPKAVFEVLFS
ncbi:SanA/YdcF family protein [Catelliglobosispora koreensis]|uniref:SanA/YdcF family protein n=1 Tax=Catelliglobosispora koreensis TaxID=129052 RepID=UPI0003600463|nr:YdcF family protein [Catelliglobosispora koreensis]